MRVQLSRKENPGVEAGAAPGWKEGSSWPLWPEILGRLPQFRPTLETVYLTGEAGRPKSLEERPKQSGQGLSISWLCLQAHCLWSYTAFPGESAPARGAHPPQNLVMYIRPPTHPRFHHWRCWGTKSDPLSSRRNHRVTHITSCIVFTQLPPTWSTGSRKGGLCWRHVALGPSLFSILCPIPLTHPASRQLDVNIGSEGI